MPSFRPDQQLCIAVGIIICLLLPSAKIVQQQALLTTTPSFPPIYNGQQFIPLPLKQQTSAPELSAQGVVIFEPYSGSVLYAKNADASLPLASLTKLMTALVAVESYNLEEEIEITQGYDVEGTKMKLVPGEKLLVKDLLAGLLILSGNDAAMALAYHHPEGYDKFVEKMNQKAKDLHMDHTSFLNPTGLDADGQYSSPHDIAILTKALLQKKQIFDLLGTSQTEVSSIDGKYIHTINTTNNLLGKIEGLEAGKTGNTLLAGECLMTVVDRQDKTIVTVVMGSTDRFGDTQKLVEWTYQNFAWTSPDLLEYNTVATQ